MEWQIPQHEHNSWLRVDEQNVILCKDAPNTACAALLLSCMVSWYRTKIKNMPDIDYENNQSDEIVHKNPEWLYHSIADFINDIYSMFKRNTVAKNLNWLIEIGYVQVKDTNDPFNRTKLYRLNAQLVFTLMLDLDDREFKCKLSKYTFKPSKSTNKRSLSNDSLSNDSGDNNYDISTEAKTMLQRISYPVGNVSWPNVIKHLKAISQKDEYSVENLLNFAIWYYTESAYRIKFNYSNKTWKLPSPPKPQRVLSMWDDFLVAMTNTSIRENLKRFAIDDDDLIQNKCHSILEKMNNSDASNRYSKKKKRKLRQRPSSE